MIESGEIKKLGLSGGWAETHKQKSLSITELRAMTSGRVASKQEDYIIGVLAICNDTELQDNKPVFNTLLLLASQTLLELETEGFGHDMLCWLLRCRIGFKGASLVLNNLVKIDSQGFFYANFKNIIETKVWSKNRAVNNLNASHIALTQVDSKMPLCILLVHIAGYMYHVDNVTRLDFRGERTKLLIESQISIKIGGKYTFKKQDCQMHKVGAQKPSRAFINLLAKYNCKSTSITHHDKKTENKAGYQYEDVNAISDSQYQVINQIEGRLKKTKINIFHNNDDKISNELIKSIN